MSQWRSANFREKLIIYSCLLNWNGCLRFLCSLVRVLHPQVPINHEQKPKENSSCNNPTTQNNQTTHFHPTYTQKKIRHTNIHLFMVYNIPLHLWSSSFPRNADLRYIFQVPGFKARPSTIGFSSFKSSPWVSLKLPGKHSVPIF